MIDGAKKHPVRTCVGCADRFPKEQLTRYVAVSGEIVQDCRGNMPGRGAYVCSAACFERAKKCGKFRRLMK